MLIGVGIFVGGMVTFYLIYKHFHPATSMICSDYGSQGDCEKNGCYWYNNSCHNMPNSEYTQFDCEKAGFYWYNNSCHVTPTEVTPETPESDEAILILREIRDELTSQMPGEEVSNRQETITDVTKILMDGLNRPLNWTSFDMTNNGPSPVYFSVNKGEWTEAPIGVGQTINIRLKKNAIKSLYMKCPSGGTTSVDFHIVR